MKVYKIKYMETTWAYFGVEATNEKEALERFDEWRYNDDYVYDTMSNTCNIDCESFIVDNVRVSKEDTLTDEMYHNL